MSWEIFKKLLDTHFDVNSVVCDCGKKFTKTNGRHMYCSRSCLEKAKYRQRKDIFTHPDEVTMVK